MSSRVALVGVALLAATATVVGQGSPSGDRTRVVRVNSRDRSYILHVPPGAGTTPLPLVLAFHGGATNAASMVRLTGFDAKADAEHFLVAYPNGTGRLRSVLTWNAGRCCAYAMDQHVDDVAFVRALLADVAIVAPVDQTRVYATGISNGGEMAYRLAAELPDRIAAIAPVAASLEVDPALVTHPMPVVHFHGTADEQVPLEGGVGSQSLSRTDFTSVARSIGPFVRVDGCRPTPTIVMLPDRVDDGTRVERRTYGGCTPGREVVLYVIRGGGHTWPGHPVLERLLGPTTRDISATDTMWEFFRRHRKES